VIVNSLVDKSGVIGQETYHEVDIVVFAKVNQEALNLAHLNLLCILCCNFPQQVDSVLEIEYGPINHLDLSGYFFMAFVATPM
jgi:hypothetical protein